MDLLEQQGVRRAQLLSTLQNMENLGHSQEDFWLLQYQQLLDRRPIKLTDNQKNIDPEFAQELLLAGMIHYLPFLANWAQTASKCFFYCFSQDIYLIYIRISEIIYN